MCWSSRAAPPSIFCGEGIPKWAVKYDGNTKFFGGFPAPIGPAFTDSDDPLADLRREGESAAKIFREQLDQVSPGLGNPVVPVKVAIEVTNPKGDQSLDQESLMQCLDRIEDDMKELEKFLFDDCSDTSTSTS